MFVDDEVSVAVDFSGILSLQTGGLLLFEMILLIYLLTSWSEICSLEIFLAQSRVK